MPDGVGRHHQLQRVVILQDLVANKALLAALAIFTHVFLYCQADSLRRKGQRAGGRVQHGHGWVSQPVAQFKTGLQQAVHRADNVLHHRFGGVIHAAPFAGLRVVLVEEGLVKVHDRVFAAAFLVILVEDAVDIGSVQHRSDIIHDHFHLIGEVAQRNKLEHLPQDADRLGDVVKGNFPVEVPIGAGASGEQAVGDRLGIEIGKLLRGQAGDQVFLKSLVKTVNCALSPL